MRFTHVVNDPAISRAAAAAATRARNSLREDLDRLRVDAGWSIAGLARAAGVVPAHLHRILRDGERPSVETYARLAAALGADLSAKVYLNTGPAIGDPHQAPMLELLLRDRHPRWVPFTEVAVRRPSRGWIDAVLHEPRERMAVASEIQSELRRLEQLIRWQAMKTEALPSWEGWDHLGEEPRVSRLLVVRRTRATRQTASEFGRQLRVAYPAHPDDALAALTGTAPWPVPALVWVALDGRGARWASGR
jgi:transcriptional regulator with XRE-family HTH domain